MSHTASLATPQAIWDGIMRQVGAITTNSLDETVDVVQALTRVKRPRGKRMALLAQTGGQSVSITDAFAKAGFEVPRFAPATYEKLGEFFNIIGGSYQNPLDMAGTVQGNPEILARILRIVDEDPNVDGMAMEMSAMFGVRHWKRNPEAFERMLDVLAEHQQRSEKPFLIVMHPVHEEQWLAENRQKFVDRGFALYPNFERAAAALARVAGLL